MSVKISIAMATFNGEKYIWDQLMSIHNQTLKPNEIIVSDDCSTDNTVAVIKRFQEFTDIRICLHRNNSNLGVRKNFERSFLKTTGDFIFPCDQDDVWFEQKIEKMIALALSKPKKNVFSCDVLLTDANLKSSNTSKLQSLKNAGLDERYHGMGCATLIRKGFLKSCLPIPANIFAHDNWINSIAFNTGTFYFTSEILQYYRRHEANESNIAANVINSTKLYLVFGRLGFLGRRRLDLEKSALMHLHEKINYISSSGSIYFDRDTTDAYKVLGRIEQSLGKENRLYLTRIVIISIWCLFFYPRVFEVIFGKRPLKKECIKRIFVLSRKVTIA